MTEYLSLVFNQEGLAVVLDREENVREVQLTSDAPEGFIVCRVTFDQDRVVAAYRSEYRPSWSGRTGRLVAEWEQLHWAKQARQQRFYSIDLETNGSTVWEVAIVAPDETLHYHEIGPLESLEHLEGRLAHLQLGDVLVGHNLLDWDLKVLHRMGIRLPRGVNVWDTLVRERELCVVRERPSYALAAAHNAVEDARLALNLARNQWLRSHSAAPGPIRERAWSMSDRLFLTPEPGWQLYTQGIDPRRCSWQELETAYEAIEPATLAPALKKVVWTAFTPPTTHGQPRPFNPASPKRVDYWHRLLPAVLDAATGRPAVLFVQHLSEITPLASILPDAFTTVDLRRGVRSLRRGSGILILHESSWRRVLSEGLPDGTVVILEKLPEDHSSEPSPDTDIPDEPNQVEPNGDDESDDEMEVDTPTPSAARKLVVPDSLLGTGAELKRKRTPDLHELGKMALWARTSTRVIPVCLDARFWLQRTNVPFRLALRRFPTTFFIDRQRLIDAGLRQHNWRFKLPLTWERDICKEFDVPSLYPFQRDYLARILPRQELAFEYVERATGGGKSLIFQAAALYRGTRTGRLTVVVSPLRALMQDQVSKLHRLGYALDVEVLSSDLSRSEIEDAYTRIAGGETMLVYCSPERFRSSGFLSALETRLSLDYSNQPEYWVFDEAHCISLWGLEFRPDYRKAATYIRKSRALVSSPAPVLLVSATLTQIAKEDIEEVLGLRNGDKNQ